MSSLSRSFILAVIFGLLFLAPSAGLSAYRFPGHQWPGEFREGANKRGEKTGLVPPGNHTEDRLSPAEEEVLLAKAQSTSKRKG